ncbi:hypothetical protein Tco_0954331 [Tanacetum coccineum]|uniref:Uncharacterized protein n=1 Tax=Tanacetum coccineum TaxID=301880 RepID=A0ABQ5E3X6_9ASTR
MHESLYDTEFEIKVVKRFQPPQSNDEDQITFLGLVYDKMDQRVEELTNSDLHSMPDDEAESISGFEAADSKEEGTENIKPKVTLTQSKKATTNNILDEMADLKASTDKPSDPLVPRIVVDAFEERMPELLSDTLINILPNIIKESIHEALLKFDQRIQETLEILTAIRAKVGKSVKKTLWKEMDIVKDLMSCCGDKLDKAIAEGEKWEKANPDPDTTDLNLQVPSSIQGEHIPNNDEMCLGGTTICARNTSSRQTSLITKQVSPELTALVVHASKEKDSEEKKTSFKYSLTPPIDENNGKGIATKEELVKYLMPLIEQGGSDTKMLNLQQFSISGKKITLEDAQAQLTEMKRLDDLKAKQEKTKQKLTALSNEELEAQAAQLAYFKAKRKRMLEEYNHYITYRDNKLPIIKISYQIDKTKVYWISIFFVNTIVSSDVLAISQGDLVGTLKITLFPKYCERQDLKCCPTRLIDDLLALDSESVL